MLSNLFKAKTSNTAPSEENVTETYAAIDLGSNSFHMIVAQFHEGELQVVDRLKEMVRLSAGLDSSNNLSEEAQERALSCLERFGQRINSLPRENVRVVGTNTLRSAHNSKQFLKKAIIALGNTIDIISGMEEARLIYLGVAHNTAADDNKRLVVDIGGGSTEVIIGEGFEPICMESLYMGCVSMTVRYFGDGVITAQALKQAELAARVELEPIYKMYKRLGWEVAIGASGTIKAVHSVVKAAAWCEEGISLAALKQLVQALKKAGHIDNIRFDGLSSKRAPVFVGGVVVLYSIFKALKLDHMEVSEGALREGLLHDLLGRIHHEDVRARSVSSLAKTFNADLDQFSRMQPTIEQCVPQLTDAWNFDPEEDSQWLLWAAMLHEIGLSISHSHYHKHGAYIVGNTDLPGFTQQEKAVLAIIIRYHRRKFDKTEFKDLPDHWSSRAMYLTILFRLIFLLHRSHDTEKMPNIQIKASKKSLKFVFPENWLDTHSLTNADLLQESIALKSADLNFEFE